MGSPRAGCGDRTPIRTPGSRSIKRRPKCPESDRQVDIPAEMDGGRLPRGLDRRSYRNGWRKWEAFATGHGATTLPGEPEALAAFVEHLADAGAIFNAVSTSYRLGPSPAAAFARTRASYRPATVARPDPPPAGVSTTSPSASIWRAHSSIFTRSRQYSSKCWRSRRVNCGQSRSHLLPPTSDVRRHLGASRRLRRRSARPQRIFGYPRAWRAWSMDGDGCRHGARSGVHWCGLTETGVPNRCRKRRSDCRIRDCMAGLHLRGTMCGSRPVGPGSCVAGVRIERGGSR